MADLDAEMSGARAQALLMQLAGLFVPGSHCIAEQMVTVRITGAP
jgi:hypothetical protein